MKIENSGESVFGLEINKRDTSFGIKNMRVHFLKVCIIHEDVFYLEVCLITSNKGFRSSTRLF